MEGAREIRKGFMCSICNGFLRDSYNLPCGHTFCLECINDALADNNVCPTCMNPAWQKDILKTALADSAVQEWVTHCEAKFLAHVARQAEQGGDDVNEDTETGSALGDESSSEEDEHGDRDVEQEQGKEKKKRASPSSPNSPATITQRQPVAPLEPKDEEVPSAAGTRVPVGEGSPGRSAGQGPGVISTHSGRNKGEGTAVGGGGGGGGGGGEGEGGALASLSDATYITVHDRHSAIGGQEKENYAASPCVRPSSATAPSAVDVVAAAAPAPRVVGVTSPVVRGSSSSPSCSSSDRNKAPRVRFQPSPLRDCVAKADPPHGEGAFGGVTSSSQRNQLPPCTVALKAKAGGAPSSLAGGGTSNAQEAAADVEQSTRELEPLEAPPSHKVVDISSASLSPGSPALAELERRSSPPPRRILEKACEDPETTPRPSPAAGRKGAAAVRDEKEASGFALALPDTCDIVDADVPAPPCSPTATTNTILFTPPAFQIGQGGSAAAAAAAARCDMDATGAASCPTGCVAVSGGGERKSKITGVVGGASAGKGVAEGCGKDGRQPRSPQNRGVGELPGDLPTPTSNEDASSSPAAEGQDVALEKSTDAGGNPLSGELKDTDVEASLANGEVRGDDSSHPPPASRAVGYPGHRSVVCPVDGADESRSEDEVSDAESVALLGGNERQQGENWQRQQHHQHQQHDPTISVTPWRAMPNSRSVSTGGGGTAGCGGGPEEIAQPSFVEAAEDEGEETCDEDCGETGAARNSFGRGEQSTPGSDVPAEERKDLATGVGDKAATRDELERPDPPEDVGSPCYPSIIPPGLRAGDDAAEREASHPAAMRDPAGTPSDTEEQPAVNLGRPASTTLAAPTATKEQHEERGCPAAQTSGSEPAVAEPARSSSSSSSSPRPGSLRGQCQASTAPIQGFSLQDERQIDKDAAGLEGDEDGGGRGELRVTETLPQTLGLGGGGVREEDEVEEPGGVDVDAAVLETAAEDVLLAEARKQKAAKSFQADAEAEDDPIVPETSVQCPTVAEVSEGRGSKSVVDGVEGLGACGVRFAARNRARAESEEQGCRGNRGDVAYYEGKTGMQEVGGEDVQGASGGPAQPADSSQRSTSSQPALLEQGSGNNRGAPQGQLAKDSSGGDELSRLKLRDSTERRLENDRVEVREALSSDEASGRSGASKEGSRAALAQCREEKAGRPVPETVAHITSQEIHTLSTQEVPETAAQSITTQQTQTLSTQEVPETARAWGSTGTTECRDSAVQLERTASGVVLPSSSCPPSEVVETQPLRDGATSPSIAGCGSGTGGDGEAKKDKRESSSTGVMRVPPSLSSPDLPKEAVVRGAAHDYPGAAREQAGDIGLDIPDGALALDTSNIAGATGVDGAANSRECLKSAKSPGSGSGSGSHRKRSANSATLSPSRTSSGPGSAEKRLRMTPPPVDGEYRRRRRRPGTATGDEEASPKGFVGCGSIGGRQEMGGGEQGAPMALRGGNDSGESDDESELPETDHDLAAVQDAWHAEANYEFGDDGGVCPYDDEPEESRPPTPRPPKNKPVFNPYAQQAHLDLRADGDDSCATDDAAGAAFTKPSPGREASEGHGVPGMAKGATTVQGQSYRPPFARPSKSIMGFGGHSVGVARAASSLGDSVLAARLKEKYYHQSSNMILGAGRGQGGTVGTTATKTSVDKTGSWSTYDMGPDTQDLAEVEARLAKKRAGGSSQHGGVATESSPYDPIDLDDYYCYDDDDDNPAIQGNSRDCGQAEGTLGETSAETKRKRSAAESAAEASKGKGPRRSTNPRRTVSSNRAASRRHRPVVVLLGCSSREVSRAQQLCEKIGLRKPETELISSATHVVIGGRHTRAPNSSSSSSRGCPLDSGTRRGIKRHELVAHDLKGYLEAVMLGLWVLDFSWVEACWVAEAEAEAEAEEAEAVNNKKRGDYGELPLAAPPRAFELLGCSKGHEGCEPRRGRYKKGFGALGAFHGIEFVPVVAETAAAGGRSSSSSPSRIELEVLRSETERLIKLGGGVLVSTLKKPSRPETGFVDNPFDSRDEETDGGGGGDASGVPAKGKKVVVLALPDCLDGNRVSQGLARAATHRRQELGADAAVDRAWVLQSAEKGFPISFGGYDLRSSGTSPEGGGNSKRAVAPKSRLSLRGSSSRCEVLLDTEGGGGRRILPEAVRAQREQTARILQRAEEVVEAPLRQKLPPLDPTGRLGEEGFDFTRRGSKKAPVKANVTTYTAENKAQRDLINALHKGGYLDLDRPEDEDEVDFDRIDKEKRLGEYWYDYVYDGFFMKRSENAIPEAKRRGCPVDILRAEHESHASIQNDRSRKCVKELPREYSVWKAGRDGDDAVELRAPSSPILTELAHSTSPAVECGLDHQWKEETGKMASPQQSEPAPKLAPNQQEQEMVPGTDHELSAAGGEMIRPVNFSEAIDRIGLGPFQTRLVIMCGMGWIIDAMEILVVAFVLEKIAITFELGSVGKGLIGSASFFGMLVGAGFWSVYADKRGRRNAFVLSLTCVFVGGVLSALSSSLALLCLCRVVVGFGVGGNLPVTAALVTEFLPTEARAKVLCRIAGTFWGVGMISASLIGLTLANVLGPGQEEAMWRWFLGIAALPSAMVAVAYRVLPESPRFLQVMGRHDEAMKVLEHVARVNGKLDVLGLDFSGQAAEKGEGANLRLQGAGVPAYGPAGSSNGAGGDREAVVPTGGHVAHGEEAENAEAGDVRELFHTPILRKITLCLWVMWLFLNISYYGVTFLLPRYYEDISGGKDDFVYILSALVGFTFIPGAFTAMWLSSPHRLGRVGTLKWSSYATAATTMLLATTIQVGAIFTIASLFTLFVIAVPGIVMYVLTPELYSTKYRAVGLGSASVVTRLGGLSAPIMAELLYDKGGPAAPLLVFGPIMIITAVAAGMIPVETAGRHLDDDSWDRKDSNPSKTADTFARHDDTETYQ
eukprot:g7839.t1